MTSLPERSIALVASVDQIQSELNDVKRQLAELEAALCQCQPQREHHDYSRPATYVHAADCIVAAAQQAVGER